MSKQSFNIYLNDDFDGISSAAVFLYFINKKWPGKYKFKYSLAVFKPGYRESWIRKKLSKPSAVFDFRYHPDADWWFDHHGTSFIFEAQKKSFKSTKQKVWDEDSKSCCGLVLKHLAKSFNFEFPGYLKKLARQADIIDAAGYKSARHALMPEEDAIKFSNFLPLGFTSGEAGVWVEKLSSEPMAKVVSIGSVRSRIKKAEKVIVESIENARNNSRILGKTILLFGGKVFSRFAVYYVYPKVPYAVIVSDKSGYYHIGAGKNPWLKIKNQKDLSKIMKEFGGGGHLNVGATEVKTKKEALQIAQKVVEILNK